MKLTEKTVDGLVDDLSFRLSGGTLAVYGKGTTTGPFAALVTVRLRTPAFEPATNGQAVVLPMEPTPIAQSGIADRAQVFTAAGDLVSELTIAKAGTAGAGKADVVVDRLELSQDGLFRIDGWALRLPATA